MPLKRRYQLLILSTVVLAVFYPTIFAEFCAIDDIQMIRHYRQLTGWSLGDVFLPRISNGIYYRPFIEITFLLDRYLFNLNPILMHLHNIVLHLINAVLVYFLALLITSERKSYLPLAASLIFALHPINTESVNWISGRTDILAAAFILSCALLLIAYKKHHRNKYLASAIAAFLAGVLTKEVAIAFLPGAVFILTARQDGEITTDKKKISRKIFFIFLACTAAALIYVLLRNMAFASNYGMIGMTFKFMANDWTHALFVFLRAFGFYMKKLLIPYPLNFAIMEIDPLYELLAMPLVIACVYIAWRNTVLSALFIAGVFLIAPSFPIAFNQIAWTPYAERYLYLPSAFIIIGVLFYLHKNLEFPNNSFRTAAVIILLAITSFATLNRNLTWQTNLSLLKDTAEKSPISKDVRLLYGNHLAMRGDYEKAIIQLKEASSIYSLYYDERPDIDLGEVYDLHGNVDEAIRVTETALQKSKGKSKNALKNLISFTEKKMNRSRDKDERIALNKKLREYKTKLAGIKK
jgi:hypothetical protein